MERERAIEILRKEYDPRGCDETLRKALETLIPELRESEDERIRKLLVWQVYRNIEDETNDLAQSVYDGIKGHDPDLEESIEDWKKCLAYLEKQKENIEKEYVFRPLAGTDITIAAEQAIRRAMEGDHLVLAFNGWYIRVDKYATTEGLVGGYFAFIEKQKEPHIPWYDLQKSKEAGYTILKTEEYEELIKQKEQKPAEWTYPYEKNETVDNLISIAECLEMDGDCSFDGMLGEDCGKFLRELARKEAMQKPEERFAEVREKYQVEWSEEDEGILKSIISRLEALAEYETQYLAKAYLEREITFLKSLHPEFKQEWTEEEKQKLNRIYSIIGWAMDEHAFNSCKKLIGDKEGVELQDFLRAIAKPEQQSYWKPSEEQMAGLSEAVSTFDGYEESDAIKSLYNDLKKLM